MSSTETAFPLAFHKLFLAAIQGDPNYQLNLADFGLKIRIQGENWSGVVDKPVARFLSEFDRRLVDERAILGVHLPLVNMVSWR